MSLRAQFLLVSRMIMIVSDHGSVNLPEFASGDEGIMHVRALA
jgi:hypothetical protein